MTLRHSPYIVTDGLVLYLDVKNSKSTVNNGILRNLMSLTLDVSTDNGADAQLDYDNGYYVGDGATQWRLYIPHADLDYDRRRFTVSVWVRHTQAHVNFETTAYNKWDNGGQTDNEWLLGAQLASGPSGFQFAVWDGSSNLTLSVTDDVGSYTVGQWYNIVGVWDYGEQELWVDGVLIDSATSATVSKINVEPNTRFWLSNFGEPNASATRSPYIDWNFAMLYSDKRLTEAEILQNYHNQRKRFGL